MTWFRPLVFAGIALMLFGNSTALYGQSPENKSGNKKLDRRTQFLVDNLKFDIKVQPKKVDRGKKFTVTLKGTLSPGHYTYPITKYAPNQNQGTKPKITFGTGENIQVFLPPKESEPQQDKSGDYKHKKPFAWTYEFVVLPDAKPGSKTIPINMKIQVCKGICVTGDYPGLEFKIDVSEKKPVQLSAKDKKRLEKTKDIESNSTAPTNTTASDSNQTNNSTLFGLMGAAAIGAFLMLLTPCVFPMIPITVNFFIKQSEKEHHNPMLSASVYSLTIILLLTCVILIFGKVVIDLANNAWFNLALGGILIFFAFSLFGMYDIELPHFLTQFTSAREGSSLIGSIFMALTFTITSFTCTGPFLGVLLAPVAGLRPPFMHLLLAALVYSIVFAAPFFFLALFPTLLKRLPKSGNWMNSIKVTMGFLELGAALKFLANTDIALNPGSPWIFNFDTVLCSWIALSLATGIYLLGVFRLPHDGPSENIGVIRMVFATIFLGLAMYMTPILFGVKPEGIISQGIVAFLPPQFRETGEELEWYRDIEIAWEEAQKEGKYLFVDFTGVNCTNCRDNENNVFPNPKVKELLEKYVRVQLYTDTVPDPSLTSSQAAAKARENMELQDVIGDFALPTYVIVRPQSDAPFTMENLKESVVAKTTGKINNRNNFINFLARPLNNSPIILPDSKKAEVEPGQKKLEPNVNQKTQPTTITSAQ